MMKAYPKYKDSGVEWLGEVPSHWDILRVKEQASLINGYPFDSKKFSNEKGIPLVRIRDISKNDTAVYFNGDVPEEALIKNGDVLIGMDGDFNVTEWKGGVAALNQRVACVRCEDKVLQKYLFYTLPFNMKIVNDVTYFTTVKHLSSFDIQRTKLAIPKKDELEKVVQFLDGETSRIDTLIAEKENFIKLLSEKRQALISRVVTKGLNSNFGMKDSGVEWIGEIPEHWVAKKLKHCLSIRNGRDYKEVETESIEGSYPVYGSGGEFRRATDYLYDGESVLLGRKGTIDKPMYVNEKFWTVDTMFYSKIHRNSDGKFLYYLATTLPFDFYQTKTALPSMTQGDLLNHPVAVPDKMEQIEIREYIDAQCEKFDDLKKEVLNSVGLLKEHRTALISAAVTGKIDVREEV
jgi:type I restriction enzyme, S subunit